MARVADNAAAQATLGLPPILNAVCRVLGCGSCLRRRREGRPSLRAPSSRYNVVSSSPPPASSVSRSHFHGHAQHQQHPASPSVRIAGARSSLDTDETSVLLPKKGLDQSFSGSPELPKPTPPKGFQFIDDSDLNSDHCPTCLESYAPDNPKIVTQCNHHFHLSCIYEWLQRSRACPVCSKPMRDAAGHRFI